MILAVLQARLSSTRLPGKVMRPLLGRPMIERQIERLRRAARIDRLVVATSVEASDDPLAAWCAASGVDVFRGPLDDVLARFAAAKIDGAISFSSPLGSSTSAVPMMMGERFSSAAEMAASSMSVSVVLKSPTA